MKEPVYEVFARKTRDQPLHHIGFLNAMGDDLARVYAWKTYDEQNWFEMCVVRRTALLPVNQTESHYADRVPEQTGKVVHAVGAASYGGSEVSGEEVPE